MTSRVKAGGRTREGFLFELSGGALCLDFVNTLDNRPAPQPKELLSAYEDLLAWARQAGALKEEHARVLKRQADARPAAAQAVLKRARARRETLFSLFSAAAAGRGPDPSELAAFNKTLPDVLTHRRVVAAEGGWRWGWDEEVALERPLWPVLASAADLLVAEDIFRVRECAAGSCAWLFLDRTRNRSRRWCDMTVCGNRDKVRRYRARRAS